MDAAQVAVASYRPAWWPAATEILIRRQSKPKWK